MKNPAPIILIVRRISGTKKNPSLELTYLFIPLIYYFINKQYLLCLFSNNNFAVTPLVRADSWHTLSMPPSRSPVVVPMPRP